MTRRQEKPQHKTNWVLFAILGFMIVLLFLDRCCSETNLRLGQSSYFEQNEGWKVATEDSQWEEVTLPHQLEASVGERYYSSFTFSEENTAGSMMRIRASMQDVFVYLDGQLIFKSIKPENDLYEIPNASLWHFRQLAGRSGRKNLDHGVGGKGRSLCRLDQRGGLWRRGQPSL